MLRLVRSADLGGGSAFDEDLRPNQAPPLGEGVAIIERRILRPLAPKGAGELVAILEVVGPVVDGQRLPGAGSSRHRRRAGPGPSLASRWPWSTVTPWLLWMVDA